MVPYSESCTYRGHIYRKATVPGYVSKLRNSVPPERNGKRNKEFRIPCSVPFHFFGDVSGRADVRNLEGVNGEKKGRKPSLFPKRKHSRTCCNIAPVQSWSSRILDVRVNSRRPQYCALGDGFSAPVHATTWASIESEGMKVTGPE